MDGVDVSIANIVPSMGELMADNVSYTAEWRRQKAAQYPANARSNLSAAEELERIVADLRALDGSILHRRLASAMEADGCAFSEKLSELSRLVGFAEFPDTGEQFSLELLRRLVAR